MTGDAVTGNAGSETGPRVRTVPAGDDRERLTCPDCGFIAYENPKIVVGSVVHHGDRILLCRRSIEPRSGFWTLPAGYLELGETPAEGARREAEEEARATIEIEGLLAVYAIRRISQVQLIHRARLLDPDRIAAGPESLEVGLFRWRDIPWAEIAFPSVTWALEAFRAVGTGPIGAPAGNPPDAEGGLAPAGV
ncbi:MAG: NUDIX hydrolase [Azospirillaceae bacterium]